MNLFNQITTFYPVLAHFDLIGAISVVPRMHCDPAHFMFVNIIRSVILIFSHKNVLLKIKEK